MFKSSLCLRSLCLLVLPCLPTGSTAHSEPLSADGMLAEIEPRLEVRPGKTTLSPDLLDVRVHGGTFKGLTWTGEVVTLLPPGMKMQAAEDLLNLQVREFSHRDYPPVHELVLHYDERFDDLDIEPLLFRHPPGNFVVLGPVEIDADLLKKLEADKRILYVEPNYRFRSDRDYAASLDDTALRKGWNMDRIQARMAWNQIQRCDPIVAVIDTGVESAHTDLRHNTWSDAGYDYQRHEPGPTDHDGHGTHCAGIIAAACGEDDDASGVCCSARLLDIRLFRTRRDYPGGAQAAVAIRHAVDNGARILSLSWSGPGRQKALEDAIDEAARRGVLIVASAGNNGRNIDRKARHRQFPASFDNPNVISVLATNKNDKVARFSNRGSISVDLGAPGVSIYSTALEDGHKLSYGTSTAVPHVAGAAALAWTKHPDYSASAIKRLLLENVREVGALKGKCESEGVLNLEFLASPEFVAFGRTKGVFELRGTLMHPVVAIGGETTGTVLETDAGSFELVVPDRGRLHEIVQDLSGEPVVVEGKLEVKRGIEIPERRIIKLREIRKDPQEEDDSTVPDSEDGR